MGDIREIFDEEQGVIWVQPDGKNTQVYPLLCADTDGIDQPQGDVTTRLCRTADRSWQVANRSQATPGDVTFDTMMWKARQRNWLQRQLEKRCPMPVYFVHSLCGRTDVWLNYDTTKVVEGATITNAPYNNMSKGTADTGGTFEKTGQTFSFSAGPPAPEIYPLTSAWCLPGVAEVESLWDITSCSTSTCAGACGPVVDSCDVMHVTAAGGAAAKANGYITVNNGGTWTVWPVGTLPFANNEDVISAVCFDVQRGVSRVLVACGVIGAAGLRVAYSDNGGNTWTVVVINLVATEAAVHSGALCALDHRHIWLCTGLGNIFFSGDGGLTWTDQNAPVPGASEGLYYIDFADANYGWAVGGFRTTPTGFFLQTIDGGEHWALAATEPKVELGISVRVHDAYVVWVTLDDGTVYFTNNWGTTWTQRVLPLAATNLGDQFWWDDYIGVLGGYATVGQVISAVVYRTWNGGFDWEYYIFTGDVFATAPPNFGINALIMCSPNEVHAVTDVLKTAAVPAVWTLKPAGW